MRNIGLRESATILGILRETENTYDFNQEKKKKRITWKLRWRDYLNIRDVIIAENYTYSLVQEKGRNKKESVYTDWSTDRARTGAVGGPRYRREPMGKNSSPDGSYYTEENRFFGTARLSSGASMQ
ncbi:hypothetical protein PUN28_006429 [Cardiocondyla obscurior]|uniref:Uncharacterized protein n=1 Tax=Cardiocondyla obscurior TaxID=286306 RepID=A0AAW2G979_9HYME